MALTLQEASKLSKDVLQQGVIETIAKESGVLSVLPFQQIEGNAYSYNVETALPTVDFRGVNEAYTANEAQFETRNEKLVILGGQVELDQFLIQTLSNVNDQKAVQVMEKAKAMSNTFTQTFFKGDSATDANSFDGLDVRVAGTEQELTADNTDNQTVLDSLNELMDAVRGGADVLYMNKRTRRKLLSIMQQSQHYIEQGQDAFGRPVSIYGGVPIMPIDDDILPTNGSNEADIYAVKFGVYTHTAGLQNGGISVNNLGQMSAKAVDVTRLEWYCGLAVFNPYSVARLKTVVV